MERYEEAMQNAKKTLQIADHMLTVTYKVVNDPKLLLGVVDRLKSSLHYCVASLCHYERLYKRIPPFEENFDSMWNTFKLRCTRKYNINIEYITLVQEVNEILKQHKKSGMEFRRNNEFVICSDTYRLRVIRSTDIKKYLEKAKLFIKEIENMVKTDERIA